MKPYQISQQAGNLTTRLNRKPKKPRTTAAMMYPWAVERNAAAWLSRYFEAFGKRTASELLAENGVDLTIDAAPGPFDGLEPSGDRQDLEQFAGQLFDKVQENSVKVHSNHFVKLRIANMALPDTSGLKADFQKKFVDRCVTSGTDQKQKIAEAIYNFKTMRGAPVKELREQIQDINAEYSDKWAAFIARNEIGNLNEAVSRAQAEAGGFDMYEWLATQDEATRPEHEAMSGLVCRYDDGSVYSDDGGKTWKKRTAGMYHGEPGTDYNCRCCGVPFAPDLYELPPDPDTTGTEAEKAEHAATTANVNAQEALQEAEKIKEQLERLRAREAKAQEAARKAAEKAEWQNSRARNLAAAEKRHAERTREHEIETQILWDLRRKEREAKAARARNLAVAEKRHQKRTAAKEKQIRRTLQVRRALPFEIWKETENIGSDYKSSVENLMLRRSNDYKTACRLLENTMTAVNMGKKDGYFQPSKNLVYLDTSCAKTNPRGKGSTLMHEHGHALDYAIAEAKRKESLKQGKTYSFRQISEEIDLETSVRNEYKKILLKEIDKFIKDNPDFYDKNPLVKNYDRNYKRRYTLLEKFVDTQTIHSGLNVDTTFKGDVHFYNCVSDIIDGVTKSSVRMNYGHDRSYWKWRHSLSHEAFAEFGELSGTAMGRDFLRTYFPESFKKWKSAVKEGANLATK